MRKCAGGGGNCQNGSAEGNAKIVSRAVDGTQWSVLCNDSRRNNVMMEGVEESVGTGESHRAPLAPFCGASLFERVLAQARSYLQVDQLQLQTSGSTDKISLRLSI